MHNTNCLETNSNGVGKRNAKEAGHEVYTGKGGKQNWKDTKMAGEKWIVRLRPT